MPLTKGSQPMSRASGRARACGGEMLAAAKADLEDDRRPAGSGPNSASGSTGPASGRRRRGRSVAMRSCWPLRRAFPLRRP